MLVRNRYLRKNVQAAKLSRTVRKYYYTGFIALGLIVCACIASVRIMSESPSDASAPSRRRLSEEAPLVAPRRRLSTDAKLEDTCDGSDDEVEKCKTIRCKMDNFCEYTVWPGPASEFERDFTFPMNDYSRTESQCNAVSGVDFIDRVSKSDLGDLAIQGNGTHIRHAEEHLWCRWDPVMLKCIHSGRFCYMLRSEELCNAYCPQYEWHNITVFEDNKEWFKHLFTDPLQVIRELKADNIKGICNGTGDPYVKVEHINHECVAGVAGAWKDFPEYLSGRPEEARENDDFNARDAGLVFSGSVVWITLVLYGFVGIAIVCDEYFEPSLTIISERLKLNPDVAGATFMAIGSSAPELFSSCVDVFIIQNNVGIGTIVGSAMFNILIIVGISAIFATVGSAEHKTKLAIDWRPVVRDVSFYTLSIFLIVAAFWDSRVMWYEGLVLVLCYVVYIIVMVFNHKMMAFCPSEAEKEEANKATDVVPVTEADKEKDELDEADQEKQKEKEKEEKSDKEKGEGGGDDSPDKKEGDGDGKGDGDDDDDDEGLWDLPKSCEEEGKVKCCIGWLWYILKAPWLGLFTITIPHCDKCPDLYPLTFIMCIVWMGGLCFVEVILVSFMGCTWNIDATVLGITFLAVGTSVPDAIASLIVARNGEGDMAIANAVGSNVFDMLLGLGLPWFIGDLIFRGTGLTIGICGLPVGIYVNRDGILVSTIILLATVAVYAIVLIACRCHLNSGVAIGLFVWYVLYLAITISSEICVGGFSWKMSNHNCDPYGGSIFNS